MSKDKKPLEGLFVVELSTYVAAPTCAKLLADMGAEVIKIEGPGGDAWRGVAGGVYYENPCFDYCNTGKKNIVLDLKAPEGMEALMRLLARADIFITNVRGQSRKKLGLDSETIRAKFPSLIYAALTGYGEKGAEANVPSFDSVAFWARSGFMADMGVKTEHSYPVTSPIGMGDSVTGMILYAGILTALIRRQQTGEGDYVSASLYNAALWSAGGMVLPAQDPWVKSPTTREQCRPEWSAFLCKDGEWLQMSIMNARQQIYEFYEVLGYPDILKDPRYATEEGRIKNNADLLKLAEKTFITKTTAEWEALFSAVDVACVKLNHFVDVPTNQQAWDNDYLQHFRYPSGKERVMPVSPVRMESQGVCYAQPARLFGQDTAQVLAEVGYAQGEIDALAASGAVVLGKSEPEL